jgi:hypothetical protein
LTVDWRGVLKHEFVECSDGSVGFVRSVTVTAFHRESTTQFYDSRVAGDGASSVDSIGTPVTPAPCDDGEFELVGDARIPASYVIVNKSHASSIGYEHVDRGCVVGSGVPGLVALANGWIVDCWDGECVASELDVLIHVEIPAEGPSCFKWGEGMSGVVKDVLKQYYAMRFLREGGGLYGERLCRDAGLAGRGDDVVLPVHHAMVERLKRACEMMPHK